MKARVSHGLSAVILAVCFVLVAAFSSFASVDGALSEAGESVISGWAVDAEHPDKSVPVVLCVYTDGSKEPQELVKVTADQYRTDLTNSAANGKHAFSYQVDWDKLKGQSFIIEAYAETDEGRVRLYGSFRYTKRKLLSLLSPLVRGRPGMPGRAPREKLTIRQSAALSWGFSRRLRTAHARSAVRMGRLSPIPEPFRKRTIRSRLISRNILLEPN